MSDHIYDGRQASQPPSTDSFEYPWAASPDIIRANQKDAYFESVLLSQLSAVIRSLYGARTAHNWLNEARTFTELLYLGLTTLIGNRTLGEEYTDMVQVEDDTHRLPGLLRRGGYIVTSVLLPYALTKFLPVLRRRLRAKLEVTMRKSHRRRTSSPTRAKQPPSKTFQVQEYILKHLDTLTSPAPLYAVSLATFYFTGAYYQLSKRLVGLRYVFTRKVEPSDQRGGYEVLGILLVLQMAVQGWLHIQDTYSSVQSTNNLISSSADPTGSNAFLDSEFEAETEAAFNAPLLFEPPQGQDPGAQRERIGQRTNTPLSSHGTHRYDLQNRQIMQWIQPAQQRKCTLCLDPMKDPAATTCGHVFCWQCVTDWLREQPMCPLCRQSALVQHVLPLRG